MPDQREANGNRGQKRAAHVSLTWLLANWVFISKLLSP